MHTTERVEYPVSVLNEPCDRQIPLDREELGRLLAEAAPGWYHGGTLRPLTWDTAEDIIQFMTMKGFWLLLKSPFGHGDRWWAGFTPHGTTGWNGTPDYYASAPTGPLAIIRAVVLWHLEHAATDSDG